VPFLLLDAAVLFGINVWEKRLKQQKDESAKEVEIHHETVKKADRALKAASRQQRRAEEKKLHANGTGGQASFVPKQNIQQPDKSKKTR